MPLLLKIGEVSLIEIGITYLVEAKSTLCDRYQSWTYVCFLWS